MSESMSYDRLIRGLLIRGIVFPGLFAVIHLLKWREYTTILCGMVPISDSTAWLAAYGGVAYVLCYLLAALVAPILMIAAAVVLGMKQIR